MLALQRVRGAGLGAWFSFSAHTGQTLWYGLVVSTGVSVVWP